MNKYIVTKNWTTKHEDPIVLKKGEKVVIDTDRTENKIGWQGWLWCISTTNQGWVPEQITQIVANMVKEYPEANILEDYSAKELNVNKDDIVLGSKIQNGWIWCTKPGDEEYGWLPLSNLQLSE